MPIRVRRDRRIAFRVRQFFRAGSMHHLRALRAHLQMQDDLGPGRGGCGEEEYGQKDAARGYFADHGVSLDE